MPSEKEVFSKTDKIFSLIGGKPRKIKEVKISETMRKDFSSFTEAEGSWDEKTGCIIIKRDQLTSLENYASTLLHEVAHAISGMKDVDRNFELELTRIIGVLASKALKNT